MSSREQRSPGQHVRRPGEPRCARQPHRRYQDSGKQDGAGHEQRAEQLAPDDRARRRPLAKQQGERAGLALPGHGRACDQEDEQRQEELEHRGRGQLAEAAHAVGLRRVAEVGRVLAVRFQEERDAREAEDAVVEEAERCYRAEQQEAVVRDAMGVAVGLVLELPPHHVLVAAPLGALGLLALESDSRRARREQREGDGERHERPRAPREAQLVADDVHQAQKATPAVR